MDLREVYTPEIFADLSFSVVAERSKASDHPDHLVKNWGGVGENFFFLFKKSFNLMSFFIFTLFFEPCVTFLLISMAIFVKMALLFSYEPTVESHGQ